VESKNARIVRGGIAGRKLFFNIGMRLRCSKTGKINLMEVKQQVDNALNVIAREFGKMGYERLGVGILNDLSVEIVATGSVHRQSYQLIMGIVVVVKYALS